MNTAVFISASLLVFIIQSVKKCASLTLRKLAHAIYREFFLLQKMKISSEKKMIFFLFLLKT